jgi:hypothetical protein
MSLPNPDPEWQEDNIMAGESEDRELDLEDALEDVKALNRIVSKQQQRIAQLESLLDRANSYIIRLERES